MKGPLLLVVLLALAPAARAVSASNGAPTLRRPTSSRAAALGGAFSAVAGGVDSMGVNPAGVAGAKRPELLSTFTSGVADDAFGFFGYAHPLKYGVLSAGLEYYDAGSITVTGASGSQQTVSAQRDFVGIAGWAMPLGGGLTVGAQAKAYQFSLAQDIKARGFAVDLGARWATPVPGLSLGAALQHLGPGVKFEAESDPLPATARAGASWTYEIRPVRDEETYYSGTRLTFSTEGVKVRDERAAAVAAGEFGLDFGASTSVALRTGYVFNQDTDGITFGVGLREGRFSADYALAAKRDLGNVQNVSVGVRF